MGGKIVYFLENFRVLQKIKAGLVIRYLGLIPNRLLAKVCFFERRWVFKIHLTERDHVKV
ncbi:hypothetical protein EGI31_04325 [Lacihabitans soyangensis]|uniref:Uncharacterized protein n=1 Tax=Lacihabitans soyangensis TaxID=869394 RepID=A0AAE3GZH6_9BACT|nr:hypothetical protein [Lacihabitans soyangensis]